MGDFAVFARRLRERADALDVTIDAQPDGEVGRGVRRQLEPRAWLLRAIADDAEVVDDG
jgi:hypothetical protein